MVLGPVAFIRSLELAGQVSGILGLLAFFGVLGFWIWVRNIAAGRAELKGLTPEGQLDFLKSRANRYGLRTDGLTAEQIYELIKIEMGHRFRQTLLLALLASAVFVTCVFVFAASPKLAPPQTPIVRGANLTKNKELNITIKTPGLSRSTYDELFAELSKDKSFNDVKSIPLENWEVGEVTFASGRKYEQSDSPLYFRLRARKDGVVRYSEPVEVDFT